MASPTLHNNPQFKQTINAVAGIILSPQHEYVLMIQKLKPEFMRGKWNFPGGKIEPGEKPVEALSREIQEECGISIKPEAWEETAKLYSTDWYVEFFSVTTPLIWQAKQQEQELVKTFELNDLLIPFKRTHLNVVQNVPFLVSLALDKSGFKKPLELFYLENMKESGKGKYVNL